MADDSRLFGYLDKKPPKQPAEPATVKPDDRIFSYIEKDPIGEQARSALSVVQDLDPDEEAANFELSQESGQSIETVRDAKEQVTNALGYPVFTIENPENIQRHLGRSYNNAAVSQDDIPALENVQKSLLDKIRESYKRGQSNVAIGRLRAQQLFGDTSEETEKQIQRIKDRQRFGTPEEQESLRRAFEEPGSKRGVQELMTPAEVADFNRQVSEVQQLNQANQPEDVSFFEEAVTGAAEQVPILINTIVNSLQRGFEGATIGAVAPVLIGQPELSPITAAGGFGFGMKAGAAEEIFKLEAGLAMDEFQEFRDENGQPLDPGVIWAASIGVGLANSSLEFVSLGFLLKTVPGAERIIGRFTKEGLEEVLKNPTVRKKLAEVAIKYGKAIGVEALTEAAQEAMTIIGGELSKILTNELDGTLFEGIDIGDAAKRVLGAARAAVGATAVLGSPGTVVSVYNAVNNTHKSNDFSANIDKDKKAVDATKTQERSRVKMKELLKEMGADDEVFISSEGWDSYLQSHNEEEIKVTADKLGINTEEAQQAVSTTTDITVKRNDILTLTPEDFNALKNDLKPSPGSYTQREIQDQKNTDDIKNSVDLLKEEKAQQDAVDLEIARIEKEIGALKLPDTQFGVTAPILLQQLVNRLANEGLDPVQKLKNITFKRTLFEKFKQRVGALFQPLDDADFELSQEIALLSTRINKLDATNPLDNKLIVKLEGQRDELDQQLRDRAFAGQEGIFQAQKGKAGTPRGVLTLDGERRIVQLFEGADLSTVLHEIGHIALIEYTDLERSGEASEALRTDMRTIRNWVGAEEGELLTRKQSEQFARGFELYLREGKAPTSALRAAFERFKSYLISVYPNAKKLKVTLADDVRQVMDRMLSANIEVEVAASENGFTVKTDKEMNELGVSEADQSFAKRVIKKLIKKAERRLSQARNLNLKDLRKRWKEEARREIRREIPAYVTIDEMIADDSAMNREDFLNANNEISDLPTARLVKKGGKSIDQIADFYFNTDAQSMIDGFNIMPPFAEAVNQRVTEKQQAHDAQFQAEDFFTDLKEYRDYLDIMAKYIARQEVDQAAVDAGIQRNIKRWGEEATQIVLETTGDITSKDAKRNIDDIVQERIATFTANQAKSVAISRNALKKLARDTMAAKTVKEARQVNKFLSSMKKASSDERRAILRKDWVEASRSNELARFNYEMATLSTKAREEVDTVLARAKRIGSKKKTETIDAEHKEAILHIISRYNLASLSPQDPETFPDYAKLFAGDEYGNDGYQSPAFMFTDTRGDFRALRMEQLRELDKAIRYLEGQGRIDAKGFLSDGNTLVSDIRDESIETIDKIKRRLKVYEEGSIMRKLSETGRRVFSYLGSLEFSVKKVDGYTSFGKDRVKGVLERWIIDPIKDGMDALLLDRAEINKIMKPHLDQISRTVRKWHKKLGNRITIEGAPLPSKLREFGQTKGWKAEQIFAVVLNTGNTGDKSNFSNLLAGYEDLTEGMVEAIKEMLTVEDMTAVQGIWDAINTLFPKADEQYLKTKNYSMTKVQATPFTFKGKEYRGGYYPIAHDRNLSYEVAARDRKKDFFNNEGAEIIVPFTKSNFSTERVNGVALPIKFDTGIIEEHIRDILLYIHLSNPIRDANKILRDKQLRKAAEKVVSKDEYNAMSMSLEHIANPRRDGLDKAGARTAEKVRGLSTAYILAWNTGVAIKQPLSTFGAIRDMGAKAYFNGFTSVLSSPSTSYQMMTELSIYMKDRLTSFDRELKSAFNSLSADQKGIYFGDRKVTWTDVKNFGFWQIRVADTLTVLPIWWGAYNDKLLPDQSNLQEAINYADDIVRASQPSAQALDLTRWQRDGGVMRLFSQFQTFTVGKYGQRQRYNYNSWRNGTLSTVDYAWFNFMDAIVPLFAINMLQSLLWGRDLEDSEEQKGIVKKVAISWATMGIPFASNIIGSIDGYFNPIDSPVLRAGNDVINGVIDGAVGLANFDDERQREKALWGIAEVLSILMGIPVTRVIKRALKGAEQEESAAGIKYLVPAPKNKK